MILITIFILAIAFAAGMISFRIWQIRSGRIEIDRTYEKADWADLSVESIRTRMLEWIQIGLHHTILFALKIWIKTSFTVKKWDTKVREKLTHTLTKNARVGITGHPSHFLKNIREHKDRMASKMPRENLYSESNDQAKL